MKKELLFVFSGLLAFTCLANSGSSVYKVTDSRNHATRVDDRAVALDASSRILTAPQKEDSESGAGEVTITVNVTIPEDSWDDFSNLLALKIENGNLIFYKADLGTPPRLWESDTFEFKLPAGTYDFMAVGHKENDEGDECGTYVIFREGVSVTEDCEMNFDTGNIGLTTVFLRKFKDGTVLTFDDIEVDGEEVEKNCFRGDQTNVIYYRGYPLYKDNYTLNSYDSYYFYINEINPALKVIHMDSSACTFGMCTFVSEIDFAKSVIAPGETNWQTASMEFAPTPINTRFLEWGEETHPKYFYCNGANVSELTNGEPDGLAWFRLDKDIPGGTIWSWISDGYDNRHEIMVYPGGNTLDSQLRFGMSGLPFRRMPDGDKLTQVGRNFLMQYLPVWPYKYSSNSYSLNNVNLRYSGIVPSAVLANCTPACVVLPMPNSTFEYDFVGRHGEDMVIDACDLNKDTNLSSSFLEAINNEQTNNVNITVNGNVVCENRAGFSAFKYPKGDYKVEVVTNNILIDGEIPGSTTAVMAFTLGGEDNSRPTVTALQVRDADDNVSDKLESQVNAFVEFFAGNFTATTNPVGKYAYCNVDALSEVVAEYSPSGLNEWESLPVTEIEELFFMPGYGYCYRADLNSINRGSENKWYDLKVKVANSVGYYQEQTLVSAFRIEDVDLSGINNLQNESMGSGRVTIYSVDGRKMNISESHLPAGIYIIDNGCATTKRIIR